MIDLFEWFGVVVLSLVVCFVGFALATPFISIWWGLQEPGNGEHTGFVTATETGGIFWKTHRAYVKTDNESSQEDVYCVTDVSVLEKLRAAQTAKRPVTVVYEGKLIVPKSECRGEDATIIDVKFTEQK